MKDDAKTTMQEAMHAFSSTFEEGRIIIQNASFSVRLGDVESALSQLGNVRPDQL